MLGNNKEISFLCIQMSLSCFHTRKIFNRIFEESNFTILIELDSSSS